MKLLSPRQVAQITGLPYNKALGMVKELAYTKVNNCYYITESKLKAYLHSEDATELTTD